MSGLAILENVRRYRTIASLYPQTAGTYAFWGQLAPCFAPARPKVRLHHEKFHFAALFRVAMGQHL
jgi:hypothetical protein